MKNFEIWDSTTNELIADNLNFDDLPELFDAYAKFFPDHEFTACYHETPAIRRCVMVVSKAEAKRIDFHSEWFILMDELLAMDNIH